MAEDGLEYLKINGKPSKRTNKGSLAIMGAMGEENLWPSPDPDQFDRALDSINTAISPKRNNARFHFMKGLTLQQLGDTEAAQKSFSRARRYGRYDDLVKRYGSQLTTSIDSGNS